MTSQQRAFVSKISKIQASEVRRQVAAGSVPSKRNAPSIELAEDIIKTTATFTCLPVYDVVDPVDFEETVSQRRAAYESASSGSPRRLQDFPSDDVEVRIVARDQTTLDSPLPGDLQFDKLDQSTADILTTYASDLCLVHRKYHQYSTGEAYNKQCFERPILAQTLPRQTYEVDLLDENQRPVSHRASYGSNLSSESTSTGGESSSTARDSNSLTNLEMSIGDPILSGVTLRVSPPQMDVSNENRRQQHRHHNLMSLLPLQFEDEVIERRNAPPFPVEHSGQKLLVKILSLEMEFEYEPIFASMALYDLKERKKLSENFYFDLNRDTVKGMLRAHIPFQDASSLSRSAVFSITYPTNDMYLVIKLEKVLQGCDISEALEPYVKEDRNRDKLRSNALEFCERLGAYRMPLAWAMIDLSKVVMGASTLERNESMASSTISSQTLTYAPSSKSFGPGDTDSIVSADRQSHMSTSTTGSFRRVGSGTSFTRNSSKPIFGKTSSLDCASTNLSNFRPVVLTVTNFFKQESERLSDDDLFKFMVEAKKPQGLVKRLKVVPVALKVEISPCPEDLHNRLTQELLRLHPYTSATENDFVKEIQEFPLKEVYAPNCAYRNLLHVYPKSVNFSSKPGSARNIAVKVELMAGQQHALPVIFGKSSCPEFSSCAYTTVSYHNKSPVFYDEIKAKLPIDLSDIHYLLFTFYHIGCKAKSADPRETQMPVGYSWLPLYKDGKLVTGDVDLAISLEALPDGCFYLSPEVNLPNMKWLDGHKPAFRVSVLATTTIHTLDDHLNSFLRFYHIVRSGKRQVADVDLQTVIRNITKAKPEPLVKFLYVILDKLLDLMVNPVTATGQTLDIASACFEMLGQLVKILTYLLDEFCDAHSRSSLLTTYIHYHRLLHKRVLDREYSSSSAGAVGRAKSVDESNSRSQSNPNMPTDLPSPDNKSLLDIIKGFEKASSVRASVDLGLAHVSYANQKCLHEELALQWVVSTGSAREMACLNAWFFLELMVKSMAEFLAVSNRLYLPRKIRFTGQFIDDVTTLCSTLTSEVISRCAKDYRQAQHINDSLAFFIRDSLSLMDRTYVLNLVKGYCKQMTAKISSLPEQACNLMLLKLDFLRILASHEHFLIINLPFTSWLPTSNSGLQLHSPSPTPSICSRSSGTSMATTTGSSQGSVGAAELTNEYRTRHFLVGLILADLATVLESGNQTLHFRAISLVRNLLNGHDADVRVGDSPMRTRVAALYLPVVGIVLDAWTQLYDPYGGKGGSRQSTDEDNFLFDGQYRYAGPGINPAVVQAISGGMTHSPPSSPTPLDSRPSSRPTLTLDATRQLLASFGWVVKNFDRHAFKSWLRELSGTRMTQLLDVLQLCISCFEFKGSGLYGVDGSSERRTILEDAMFGPHTPRAEYLRNKKMSSSTPCPVGDTPVGVRWRKEHVHGRKPAAGGSADFDPKDFDADPVTEGNLAAEIGMIVLDTLELVLQVISAPGADHLFHLVPLVTRVMLHMLACNQSVLVLENLFASQRALVAKYPDLIFEQEAEQCGDLCLQLLRHCAGRLTPVRSQAAASLYLLMRQSFEYGSNFARVKMQITVSLSTLVSSSTRFGLWFNEDQLRRSLKTVLTYAETDAENDGDLRETSFAEQVKDLIFNLHMILSDTVKMKEFQNDFEMLMDLMYRIAKGYQNSPDLRLTWLQNMATKHVEKHNFAEASQCMLHAAALSSEYLHMMEDLEYLPGGAADFLRLTENILEESAVSDDVVSPEEEGICESRYFTENGLLMLLEQAACHCDKALMYEAMEWTYKLMLPVLEEARDYGRISQIHLRISEALAKIDCQNIPSDISPAMYLLQPISSPDKRVFGTYFRVGFYGSKFGDLDGMEYVYKEPAITKLPEISHRLESFYIDRFGRGVVHVVKDSNVVDRMKLDSEKVYLQITYVEPYFDSWELRRRPTQFERNFNVRRFAYATPFTMDGRAHGDLKDQYKRRTVITTANSFPYVKTRIQVIDREQTILSPIEVAIEDIQKKTRELAAATAQEPPDAKMLQMVIQGCIGTTVNQGPMEMANSFLGDMSLDSTGRPVMNKCQNKLRLCFKDFSKKCSDALRKNKRLIAPDQEAYQKELERNYVEFTKKLSPLVSMACVQTMKRQKHDHQRDTSSICEIDDEESVTAV